LFDSIFSVSVFFVWTKQVKLRFHFDPNCHINWLLMKNDAR